MRQGAIERRAGFRDHVGGWRNAIDRGQTVGIAEQRVRLGQILIERRCLLEAGQRVENRAPAPGEKRAALQQQFVGLDIARHPRDESLAGAKRERHLQAIGDGTGNLVLDVEDVLQLAIVAVRPELESVRRVHELHGHAHPIARSADAALQDRGNAQFAGDLLKIARAGCGTKTPTPAPRRAGRAAR